MFYRCELLINGSAYDVTECLKNWDDVQLSYKRGNYDGVVRSFSTKFVFVNEAYSLLVDEFERVYLSAKATVVFYKRNNSWRWNEVFRCALDYSTFTHDGYSCEINAIDDSLASLIKANKSTQYEYHVSELMDSKQLKYDRIEMKNKIEWISPSNTDEGSTEIITKNGAYPIPLYISVSEVTSNGVSEYMDVSANKLSLSDVSKVDYFFKNVSGRSLTINVKASFSMIANIGTNNGGIPTVNLFLERRGENGNDEIYREYILSNGIKKVSINREIILNNGDELVFYMTTNSDTDVIQTIYDVITPLTVEYMYRGVAVNINVIKPITLLNRLLQSMSNNDDVIAEIAFDERLDKTVLIAADSIRNIADAKIYTSYSKFCEWMIAEFGYIPVIEEKKVTFVHRDTLFNEKISFDLGAKVTGFEYSVNSGLIYSSVKVGYNKKEYDSVNGRDEFHFTTEYTTGTTLSDNTLNLISPYRADAYGIEFLVNERGEDTTDNKSDKDVFMMAVTRTGQYYWVDRSVSITGVISPSTMYNAIYSPNYMIAANKKHIGMFCEKLTYASSDGNSDVVVGGFRLSDDIEVTDRLFTAAEVVVETDNVEIDSDLLGCISFEKNGKAYTCYLLDVDYNISKAEKVKYRLIVKDISI